MRWGGRRVAVAAIGQSPMLPRFWSAAMKPSQDKARGVGRQGRRGEDPEQLQYFYKNRVASFITLCIKSWGTENNIIRLPFAGCFGSIY